MGVAMTDPIVPSDEDLLARFAGGDDGALGELAERLEGELLGLARGLLGGSSGLAEEAVQEAWVRVIRFAPRYEGRASVRTWVWRVAINRCREVAARERRAARKRGVSPKASRDPHESASAAELNGSLHAALGRLPEREREAVVLCYHAGLSRREAAAVLGVAEGTMKSRARSAIRRLRRELGPLVEGRSDGSEP